MEESESLLIKVDPKEIIFFDKIIESIDNLGIVTVKNGKEGLLEILSPLSLREELMEVLLNIGTGFTIISEQETK